MGPNNDLTGYCDDPVLKGLIPRIIESIFEHVQSADQALEFTIQVSYLEIYLEKLKDLLDRMFNCCYNTLTLSKPQKTIYL